MNGGMFGAKPDWGQAIAAALNGYLAAGGNQVGAMNLRQMHDQRMSQQQQALAQQEYERQRADKRDDFVFEQDYRSQHQAPDDFTQMMQAAGIDPHSEQGKALYLQAIQNKANPFTQMRVQNPDGSESLQFMRPPVAPTAPVGPLTIIPDEGGAGAVPPRGFLGF